MDYLFGRLELAIGPSCRGLLAEFLDVLQLASQRDDDLDYRVSRGMRGFAMSRHVFSSHLLTFIRLLVVCGLTLFCACERSPTSPARNENGDSEVQRNSHADIREWDEIQVEVTGKEFQWHYRFAGRDGKLGTDDDRLALRDLHLPAHTPAKLELKSRDYLYTYAIPEFDKKEIAVPDMTFSVEFVTAEPGQLEFRGDQFCGYSHPLLSGQLVIESAAEFNQWLDSLAPYTEID